MCKCTICTHSDWNWTGDACDHGHDWDWDGVPAIYDNCPFRSNPDQADADADDVGDECDTCPTDYDDTQADGDCDGLGDACDTESDRDHDGTPDDADLCPDDSRFEEFDGDGDGIGDICDNCSAAYNPGQGDLDHDWVGDTCDPVTDVDYDTVPDTADNCRTTYNQDQLDSEADGFGDRCDLCPDDPDVVEAPDIDYDGVGDPCDDDRDGDGIVNAEDLCAGVRDPWQQDADGDGIGDRCDNCIHAPNPEQAEGSGGFGTACVPEANGAQPQPLWRFYVGPAVGIVAFAGGLGRLSGFGPAPLSVSLEDPFTGRTGTAPLLARPRSLIGTELLSRLQACGIRPFTASDIPLPSAYVERFRLRLHQWFVLSEEERVFAIVDIDGHKVRWRQYSRIGVATEEATGGQLVTTWTGESPRSDLGYFLAHFSCGGGVP